MLTCIDINNEDLGLGMRGYDDLPHRSVATHEKGQLLQHGTPVQSSYGGDTNVVNSPSTGTATFDGDQYPSHNAL
jgi:hypothetical protein